MTGLVDGNNFYVSCERVFDASLERRPVAVLSNNDGCVISRSQEFKELGIKMGTPYFQLRDLERRNSIVLKSSNYELYGDMSRRMVSILGDFTADVQQYSIDEAFIDISTTSETDFTALASKIRATILKWIGIPCGIGFARTKTLAKLANHIAKKKEDGVFTMPDDAARILRQCPVNEIWGVGHRLAGKLNASGIDTALQLAETDNASLARRFSITLARTAMELRGTSALVNENPEEPSQSISCSRSFGHPVTDLADLQEAVAFYTSSCAEKLRSERQVAAGANIYLEHYPASDTQSSGSRITSTTIPFHAPTDDTAAMLHCLRPAVPGLYSSRRRYKKAGVVLFGLEPKSNLEMDMFRSADNDARRDELYSAVDRINRDFGRGTLFTLSTGIKRPWQMKRGMLSPSYTTKWSDIPSAN